MRRFGQWSCALLGLLAFTGVALGAEPDADERKALLAGLPKVPARSTMAKDGDADESGKINQWVASLIEGKEKKAKVELEGFKKSVLAEEEKRLEEERERRRREERARVAEGTLGPVSSGALERRALRLRLDFQVPEIASYRFAAETSRAQQAAANEMATAFGRLDRDGDGNLSGIEYRDAAAIYTATSRLLEKLDGNGDGALTADEMEAVRLVPATAAGAANTGRNDIPAGSAFRIKTFDKDANGVLDMVERMALSRAYVDAALRAGRDAAFYALVADALSVSRTAVAAKFANIEIGP